MDIYNEIFVKKKFINLSIVSRFQKFRIFLYFCYQFSVHITKYSTTKFDNWFKMFHYSKRKALHFLRFIDILSYRVIELKYFLISVLLIKWLNIHLISKEIQQSINSIRNEIKSQHSNAYGHVYYISMTNPWHGVYL